MKTLIKGTTAYAVFIGDKKENRVSHAYMLHFSDADNLRGALMVFALAFFGVDERDPLAKRIADGAGVDIAEVNRLVKQFEQARKMMKQIPGMMGGKRGKRGRFNLPF